MTIPPPMPEPAPLQTSSAEASRSRFDLQHAGLAGLAIAAFMACIFAVSVATVDALVTYTQSQGVSPLAKPSSNQVTTAAMWGIDISAVDTKNDQDAALSTTPIEALDSDLSSTEQDEQYSQNLYICNFDDTDHLCLGGTTWSDTCGAGDMTCHSGATTDGLIVKANTCRHIRLLGTERPCIQGAAAISTYQVERITYRGTEY